MIVAEVNCSLTAGLLAFLFMTVASLSSCRTTWICQRATSEPCRKETWPPLKESRLASTRLRLFCSAWTWPSGQVRSRACVGSTSVVKCLLKCAKNRRFGVSSRRTRQAECCDAAAAPVCWTERHLCSPPHQSPQQCVCSPGNGHIFLTNDTTWLKA